MLKTGLKPPVDENRNILFYWVSFQKPMNLNSYLTKNQLHFSKKMFFKKWLSSNLVHSYVHNHDCLSKINKKISKKNVIIRKTKLLLATFYLVGYNLPSAQDLLLVINWVWPYRQNVREILSSIPLNLKAPILYRPGFTTLVATITAIPVKHKNTQIQSTFKKNILPTSLAFMFESQKETPQNTKHCCYCWWHP